MLLIMVDGGELQIFSAAPDAAKLGLLRPLLADNRHCTADSGLIPADWRCWFHWSDLRSVTSDAHQRD